MKEMYHIGISSGGKEVLFRDETDYFHAFNCLAIGLHKFNSQLYADSFMSTHTHWVVFSENVADLVKYFKNSYMPYFNSKYSRKGPFINAPYFASELKGIRHILAAESYVFRNCMHHGVCQTPFGYPHTSANCVFQKALGKTCESDLITSRVDISKHLPRRADFPDNYRMGKNGVFLRESVLQTTHVELQYVTPRSFLYYMTRLSGVEWVKEQEQDRCGNPAVTLESIEEGMCSSVLREGNQRMSGGDGGVGGAGGAGGLRGAGGAGSLRSGGGVGSLRGAGVDGSLRSGGVFGSLRSAGVFGGGDVSDDSRQLSYKRFYQKIASNERARFEAHPISDIELCRLIDSTYVPKYRKPSVYHLSDMEKGDIAKILVHKNHATMNQLRRCLLFRGDLYKV